MHGGYEHGFFGKRDNILNDVSFLSASADKSEQSEG